MIAKRMLIALMAFLCFTGISFAQKAKHNTGKTVVEVLYFHGKQRCPTCVAIGKNSREVVLKELAPQVKAGLVRFKEIDITTPEGEKLADKYRVTWASLFVNQWKNGKEQRNDMTRFGFENARAKTKLFRSELKAKILQLLKK